jgi:hypothetical protein
MQQFRQNIFEISRLDILTLKTAASISEAIMFKEGAFDDVVAVTGVARDFIQKCVVGGRVCLSDNEAKVVHGMVADLDGCLCTLVQFIDWKGMQEELRRAFINPH